MTAYSLIQLAEPEGITGSLVGQALNRKTVANPTMWAGLWAAWEGATAATVSYAGLIPVLCKTTTDFIPCNSAVCHISIVEYLEMMLNQPLHAYPMTALSLGSNFL